jgi:hypothetical protein
MDLCRPRLLCECSGSGISQLCSRRNRGSPRLLALSGGFIPVRARKSERVVNFSCGGDVRGSRRIFHTYSAPRIPSQNPNCGWRGFGRSRRAPKTSSGVVHFEQGDRSSSDGNATGSENGERLPFDLDLAVVLAGFAFEAYNTPAVRDLPISCFSLLFSKLLSNCRGGVLNFWKHGECSATRVMN